MEPAKQPIVSSTPGAVPLSCQLCRKRKIKCDKQHPCSNCVTAQKECIPVVRARLPRGRNGGRKGINSELRNRINRLEGLVQSLNSGLLPEGAFAEVATEKIRTNSEPQLSNTSGQFNQKQAKHSDSPEATPDTTQWLGSTLWTQLAHELNGIHSVLEAEDDDEDNNQVDGSSPLSMTTDSAGTPRDILFMSHPVSAPAVSGSDLLEYTKIFRRNVDYILKFVHLPSFEKLVLTKGPYLGHPADSAFAQALVASALYASTCSLSNSHCLSSFNKTKESLRNEWQQTAFQSLAKAEIVKFPNLVSLQALLLYIAALRSHQNDQQSWMLVSLAVRMAQSLQLHREESYSVLPWAQAETRRRTWWTLIALDYQASMDRGSDLMVVDRSWTTKPPTPCVDSDYALDATAPITDIGPCSGMMFNVIHCKSNPLLRRLNWILPGEAEMPPTPIQSSWKVRQDAIANLEREFEDDIMFHLHGDDVAHYACLSFIRVLINCAQLYAARPLQRHPALTLPPPGHINIMLIAVEAIEVKRNLLSDATEPWHWVIKGFVEWHGLAVLLAELCNPDQYDPQLVERAWNVAQISFDTLSSQIAEGTQGPLWKPMKKLMRSAQRRRLGTPLVPTATKPTLAGEPVDDLSAYTNIAMDLTAMDQSMATGQGWNTGLDPLQSSWFNWQTFTDDLAQSNGFGWGAMDFDPVFGGL